VVPDAPFSAADTERIRNHLDTPAAYVRWREVLPLLNFRYATALGNQLGWSLCEADRPIAASSDLLRKWLDTQDDDLLDRFLLGLAETTLINFLDGALPFLIGVADLPDGSLKTSWTQDFLNQREQPVPAWPETLLLELTQSCNFACIMCSCRTGGYRPEKTMPLPAFGELIRQFAPHIRNLRLNGYGESTVIPNFTSYLDCLLEFGFKGSREIITNLSGPLATYERMVEERFALIASWDATSAPLQQAIRTGADFTCQRETLTRLGRLVRPRPEQLVLLCTVQQLNLTEIPKMVDFAATHGSGLVLFNMIKESDGSPWMDRRFGEIASLFAEAQRRARASGIEIRIPDHIGSKPLLLMGTRGTSAHGCDRPWKELLIRYDLEAQPCNMFHPWSYGLLRLGNWELDMEARFRSVWNSRSAATYRSHVNKRPRHPYCANCYWMR
jgi:MoaA/NifB/PqqE/SkfB family radical SAM enzyme